MPPLTIGGDGIVFSGCPSVRPSVRPVRPLTPISRTEGFQWLAEIFVMWEGIVERGFMVREVRGQGQGHW